MATDSILDRSADSDAPALDAYPAGEGYDLLLCGEHNDTEWIQTDSPVDLEVWL